MAFEIRKAERRKAKARVGIGGPAGSGKTASSLLVAFGLTGDWGKIGFIDTENGSGELYVNATIGGTRIGEYLYGRIESPFTPQKYIDAIKALEQAGVECIIIDSLSHAWAGEGGLLEQQGREADRSGNSYTAWRKVTPQHNQLVEAILQSKCHIMTTIRAKTEYSQEKGDNGKTVVKKVGMGLVQREGMDYEFTIMLDIGQDHVAFASKDRTSLFDGQYFKPSVETGKALLTWLETGSDAPAPSPTTAPPPVPAQSAQPSKPVNATPTTVTEADVDALLKERVRHADSWAPIMEAFNTRNLTVTGESDSDKLASIKANLLTFTRNELDVLMKTVKALPFKSQANK